MHNLVPPRELSFSISFLYALIFQQTAANTHGNPPSSSSWLQVLSCTITIKPAHCALQASLAGARLCIWRVEGGQLFFLHLNDSELLRSVGIISQPRETSDVNMWGTYKHLLTQDDTRLHVTKSCLHLSSAPQYHWTPLASTVAITFPLSHKCIDTQTSDMP